MLKGKLNSLKDKLYSEEPAKSEKTLKVKVEKTKEKLNKSKKK